MMNEHRSQSDSERSKKKKKSIWLIVKQKKKKKNLLAHWRDGAAANGEVMSPWLPSWSNGLWKIKIIKLVMP